MAQAVAQGWAGIDVGKGHHWVCLIDESGRAVWSRKVVNDEAAILDAIGEVRSRAERVSWAVDITGTSIALLMALLLVTHRTDLVADRVWLINRLRDVLSGYFPALERAFDYSASRAALVLLTGYQTPAAIRGRGRSRLASWLTARKVRSAAQVATLAVAAADAQTPPSPDRMSPRASSLSSPRPCWTSTSAFMRWTRGSARPSTPTPRRRSSSPCPESAPSSVPSSSPRQET